MKGRIFPFPRIFHCVLCATIIVGCTQCRHSFDPNVEGGKALRNRYRIVSCRTYRADDGGLELQEAPYLSKDVLGLMQAARPDVFSSDGVPVNLTFRTDWSGGGFWYCLSGLLSVCSVAMLPGFSRVEQRALVTVETYVSGRLVKDEFRMRSETCHSESLSGLNYLFPYEPRPDMRFSTVAANNMATAESNVTRYQRCQAEAYAYAVAATLARMEKDLTMEVAPRPESGDVSRQLLEAGVLSKEDLERTNEDSASSRSLNTAARR